MKIREIRRLSGNDCFTGNFCDVFYDRLTGSDREKGKYARFLRGYAACPPEHRAAVSRAAQALTGLTMDELLGEALERAIVTTGGEI